MSKIKYNREWPDSTPDVTIELIGFNQYGKTEGFLTRYEHAINAFQLLWPKYPIWVTFPETPYYMDRGLNGMRIENVFLTTALKALCEHSEVGLTGCASSGKSFCASAYNLMCFYSSPMDTLQMLSTTSGLALKQRVWAEIKKLHNEASEVFSVGTIIDYLNVLLFDPSLAFTDEKDASLRDMRNGIIGVAIPVGSEGDKALSTIAGRKNENVRWTIDEMAYMPDNVLSPCANLEANPRFQLIVMANAKSQNDSHGRFSEPKGGWPEEFNESTWVTKTGGVCVHLDGLKSPNMFEGHERIDDPTKLPFPKLINHLSLERMAIREGQGDPEQGRKSAGYWMMARGIWLPSSLDTTVLSKTIITSTGADKPVTGWAGRTTRIAAADPSFTIGGDKFYLQLGTIGVDADSGASVLVPDAEPILITPDMGTPGDLYDQLAAKVVRVLHANSISPGNFGMDVSHDGGLMMQAIAKLWGTNEILGISSLGTPTERPVSDQDPAKAKDRYDRQVTEYWFSLRVACQLGRIKGFNVNSVYAKDLFERRYTFTAGGKTSIEVKGDMKKRIGRSPDGGDVMSYLLEVARRAGLLPMERTEAAPPVARTLSFDPITLKPKEKESHPALKEKAFDSGWTHLRTPKRKSVGWRY